MSDNRRYDFLSSASCSFGVVNALVSECQERAGGDADSTGHLDLENFVQQRFADHRVVGRGCAGRNSECSGRGGASSSAVESGGVRRSKLV